MADIDPLEDDIEEFGEEAGETAAPKGEGATKRKPEEVGDAPATRGDNGDGDGEAEEGNGEGEGDDKGDEGDGQPKDKPEEGEGEPEEGEVGEGEEGTEGEGEGAEGQGETDEGEGEAEEQEGEGEGEGEEGEDEKDEGVPDPPEDSENVDSFVNKILTDACGVEKKNINAIVSILPQATHNAVVAIQNVTDDFDRIPIDYFELDKETGKSLLLYMRKHVDYFKGRDTKLNFPTIIYDQLRHHSVWFFNVVVIEDRFFIAKLDEDLFHIYETSENKTKISKYVVAVDHDGREAKISGTDSENLEYAIMEHIVAKLHQWNEAGDYADHVQNQEISEKLIKLMHEFVTFVKSGATKTK